jgi:hypothetical protein
MRTMKCTLLALVSFALLTGCNGKVDAASNPDAGAAGALAAPADKKAGGCCSEGAGDGDACCSEGKAVDAAAKKADGACCGSCAPETKPVAPVSPQ